MRVVRALGRTLIVLGALFLYFALYEEVGTGFAAGREQATLRRQFSRLEAASQPTVTAPPAAGGRTATVRGAARGRPIARLRVPSLQLNVIVVEGVSFSELAKGPGRYPGSAAIGATGSVAIAGHRTGWGAPFLNLDRLRAGDRITLQTPTAVHTYAVTRKLVVEPRDTWVLQGDPRSSAERKLALTTCTPKFTALRRLIVWADEIARTARATP